MGCPLKACDDAEQSRFSAPAGAEQDDEFSLADFKIDAVESAKRIDAVPHIEILYYAAHRDLRRGLGKKNGPHFHGISRRSIQLMIAFMANPSIPIVIIPTTRFSVCISTRLFWMA